MPSKPWPPQSIKSPEPNIIIKISKAQKQFLKKKKIVTTALVIVNPIMLKLKNIYYKTNIHSVFTKY